MAYMDAAGAALKLSSAGSALGLRSDLAVSPGLLQKLVSRRSVAQRPAHGNSTLDTRAIAIRRLPGIDSYDSPVRKWGPGPRLDHTGGV
jgi:hypothetical protein